MTYQEQIKSPLWQKKRLEILNRDEFTCQECGDKKNTLNVHHKYYKKNYKVWDYENNELITLCKDCHEINHDLLDDCRQILGNMSNEQVGYCVDILNKIESMIPPECHDVLEYVTNLVKK